MKRCPICGQWPITDAGFDGHMRVKHTPKPRTCLICAASTCGADALCADCQHMPPDEIQTALHGMVGLGDINDFDTPERSHAEHMTDEDEGKRMYWLTVVASLLAYHGVMLDDGAGYGE